MNKDYLITKLENGNSLNIVVLSHNSYWPEIQKLGNHFKNCNVMCFGNSTFYIKLADIKRQNEIENCDLIIFYSSEFYNEEELIELKNIAFKISNDKNKRVSIGYSYLIPMEQRPYDNISGQIEISSFKNSTETIEKMHSMPYFTAYDLVELTLATTDRYDNIEYADPIIEEKQKVLEKSITPKKI